MPFQLPFEKKKNPLNPVGLCSSDICFVNLSVFSASELFAGADPEKVIQELTMISKSYGSAISYHRLPAGSTKDLSEHSKYYLNLIDKAIEDVNLSLDDNSKATYSLRFALLQPLLVNLVAAAEVLKNEKTQEQEQKSSHSVRFM
ncbi:TPA: hypothetical protein ACIZAC_001302 [Legionella pneumophila]|uniref:hypothetical protein n=1 Tax=Legionella pneumophila TaxID=446 RepID=UPI000B073500|nr:hypothetical protein [Legionella pneumophila]MDW9168798.1 hypothetical protein [Legionella pneumophila subsp. fraseri]MDX1847661.1 hypothetical protein [Legionella pneumophila subsp. fraseri]